MLALDEDVTFSLDTNGPFATPISKALIAQRREIIAHIPAKQTKEKAAESDADEIDRLIMKLKEILETDND